MRTLAYLRNLLSGQRIDLKNDTLALGRDSDNTLVIDDPKVSRKHASIVFNKNAYWLQDLESRNGSYVNQEKISLHQLIHGDQITVGDHIFIFFREDDKHSFLTSIDRNFLDFPSPADPSSTQNLDVSDIFLSTLTPSDPFSKFYLFSQRIHGHFDQDQLMQTAVSLLGELLEAPRVDWLEPIGEADVEFKHTYQSSSTDTNSEQKPLRPLIEKVLEQKKALLEIHQNRESGSAMGIPLMEQEICTGVFYFSRPSQSTPFDKQDLRLAAAMINQLARQLGTLSLAKKLTDSIKFNNAVQNSLHTGLLIVGANGVIRRVNSIAAHLIGLSPSNITGRPLGDLPGLSSLENHLSKTLTTGRSQDFVETVIYDEKDQKIPVGLICSPILSEEGTLLGAIANIQNLSEIKKLNEEIQRAQQLSALGQMSAGIAHEIRNPLNAIRGFVELIEETEQGTPSLKEYLQIVVGEVDRINRLVEDLLDLARETHFQLKDVSIAQIIDSLHPIIKMEVQHQGFTLVFENTLDPAQQICTNTDKLAQVLSNLVRNACDALSDYEKGTVVFKAHEDSHDLMPYGAIRLDIQDNGCGISEENLKNIFNPFFSTKDSGTGLGLAISQKIIEAMEGELTVESYVDKGTTFSVWLPKNLPRDE